MLLESNTIEVPEWMQEQSAKFLSYTKGIKWEDNSDEVKSFLMRDALYTLKLTMIFNKIRKAEKETELSHEEIQTVLMQNLGALPEDMQKAIIDKNVIVPANTRIGFNKEEDIKRGFHVSPNGVTVVPKGAKL